MSFQFYPYFPDVLRNYLQLTRALYMSPTVFLAMTIQIKVFWNVTSCS